MTVIDNKKLEEKSCNNANSDSSFDQPLITFSIHNPFKRLLVWLNDIRKKQTTTFDIKVKIPLIALPIFLIIIGSSFQLFFNLGKQSEKKQIIIPTSTPTVQISPTISEPLIVTHLGTIKATYQVRNLINQLSPTPSMLPIETVASSSSDTASETTLTLTPTKSLPTPTTILPVRYVLLEKYNKMLFLIIPSNFSLNNYLNQEVLVTGIYDKEKNTLTISKISDIELVP